MMSLRRVWFPILVLAGLPGLAATLAIIGLSSSTPARRVASHVPSPTASVVVPVAHSASAVAPSSSLFVTSWPEFPLGRVLP
jgi:hypothetical protein